MRFLIFLLALLLAQGAAAWPALPPGPEEIKPEAEFFAGNDTVVYLEDLQNGRVYAVQPQRIKDRHPPFSSFKIPNLLIALETGALDGLDSPIPYHPEQRPAFEFWPADWAQDQTLRTAFRRSAAWAFQDLALLVGDEAYQGYLSHFSYGNEVGKGDEFWLDRSLQVSPKEQVDFLRKLLTNQLEVAPLHLELLREVAQAKSVEGFTLYGKTGAGPLKANDFSGPFQGWYVGWLERPGQAPLAFALWTQGPSFEAIRDYRRQAVERLLEESGFLPLNWNAEPHSGKS